MNLHKLLESPPIKRKKARVRPGRGNGSGLGQTSGRGTKGCGSRSGHKHRYYYEGGQMPIVRRIPKVGFNNKWRKEFALLNVQDLNAFEDGATISPEVLLETGVIDALGDGVKILGMGTLERKLAVEAHKFTAAARAKILEAGGTVSEIASPKPKRGKIARRRVASAKRREDLVARMKKATEEHRVAKKAKKEERARVGKPKAEEAQKGKEKKVKEKKSKEEKKKGAEAEGE